MELSSTTSTFIAIEWLTIFCSVLAPADVTLLQTSPDSNIYLNQVSRELVYDSEWSLLVERNALIQYTLVSISMLVSVSPSAVFLYSLCLGIYRKNKRCKLDTTVGIVT
ncbi:hypothetical protein F4782DRAFT_504358 [Xylaria castorea]|nr:hypothetical protein F4782DRAFT_504358 [Xylaria castorea]